MQRIKCLFDAFNATINFKWFLNCLIKKICKRNLQEEEVQIMS